MGKKTEEQSILDRINKNNYMEYKDNPMFDRDANPPKGLTSDQLKTWNRYHFLINQEPEEGSEGGNISSNSTVNKFGVANPPTSGSLFNTNSNKSNVSGIDSITKNLPTKKSDSKSDSKSGSESGIGNKSGSNKGGTGDTGAGKYNTSATKSIAKDIMNKAVSGFETKVEKNAAQVSSKTDRAAQKRLFDTKKGHTGDRYIDFSTIKKEKKLAERDLREAEAANQQLQTYKSLLDRYEQIASQIEKRAKSGDGVIDPEEEKKKLQVVNDRITFLDNAIYSMANPLMKDAPFSNSEDEKKWKELNNELAEINGQKAVIMDRINRGESFQELKKPLIGFTQDLRKTLGAEIDEFGKWSMKDGSDVNRYQAEVAKGIYTKIDQVLEDGKVTPEEARAIGKLNKEISKLIEEERLKDPNIMDAEDRVNSASAKYGYFLFDQIKAWAVLLVGLSQGNASMVYSAMDMFNKKIADAEAGYTVDEIKAFSNNNVKNITGSADAQYSMEQILPELEKNKAFKEMSQADKALAVEQLELAFEEYQRYVSGGGKEDFAVWFATQQNNGSGWAGVIQQLISAGALNMDLLSNWLSPKESKTNNKKTSNKDVGYNLDTSGVTQGIAQSILGAVKTEEEKSQQTKKLRDVQSTVNNAVASRMGGQGASPQGVGNAAPVNTSWGRA